MSTENSNHSNTGNKLFPVFFKLENLHLLIVGGGYVGLEKVSAVLKNAPEASVTIVAPEIRGEIKELAHLHKGLVLIEEPYNPVFLEGKDLVIAGTSLKELNHQVWADAKERHILINVADTPDLCDFYLSSVVKKGDLKIAVSTNGKSPTFAKRMREMLEEILPEEIDDVLENLQSIRDKLKGDFDFKVKKLNEITSVMKDKK
ncbi:bifunctional precorrin-2 dehydrogenase/sirohydrochlorin ferrochelatase [Cytophagaceae bacterium ABcell3]|nr:bifunctional precorrin-2 dehydrogenase/sirohydrochlorin ferrochelatase [Cytophagaceae bacterium ABcell3]